MGDKKFICLLFPFCREKSLKQVNDKKKKFLLFFCRDIVPCKNSSMWIDYKKNRTLRKTFGKKKLMNCV